MTKEQLDVDTFNGNIPDTNTETLEVDTSRASDVVVLLDDGTTDSAPATYDMTQRFYIPQIDDYQFYDEVTATTGRAFTDPAWGSKLQADFTNQSGTGANYRITLISYRTLD